MNVLIIGSGAREHAIAWKISQSPLLGNLFVTPGNAGTEQIAENILIPQPKSGSMVFAWESYFRSLIRVILSLQIDLVVAQSEELLTNGIVDYIQEHTGVLVFGASREASRIEGSKIFAHNFVHRKVTQARAIVVHQPLEKLPKGFRVVKQDGLASGKGVVVANNEVEAIALANKNFETRSFGHSGSGLLVQEFLTGLEVSAHAFCDGKYAAWMPLSCDYKRIGEGNTGSNTGGVGCFSSPELPEIESSWNSTEELINSGITSKTIRLLELAGKKFRGVLYPGLVITKQGPKVIEYNCRFGDPETQTLLPRFEGDLLRVMDHCLTQGLPNLNLPWNDDKTVCVVLCSGGYPEDFEKEKIISGLNNLPSDVLVFHGGTTTDERYRVVTTSGRVLSVVAKAKTFKAARRKVYAAIKEIHFEGMYYRRDIAINL